MHKMNDGDESALSRFESAARLRGDSARGERRPRRALDELQPALEPDVFLPATAERRFVVALNNFDAPVDSLRSQTLVVDHYVVVTRFIREAGPAALQPIVGPTAKKRYQDFASLYVRREKHANSARRHRTHRHVSNDDRDRAFRGWRVTIRIAS
jgi:hypothetical protein